MKIAVLIFGEYRTFESVVRSWNCRFWDDVDFYMSTWDYSLEPIERQRFILDWKDEKWANEEFIKKTLLGVNLKIHESNSDIYEQIHDTKKMVFHWKSLYQMIIDSKKEYDCIFMIRTDSMFFVEDKFFRSTKKDTLYLEAVNEDGIHDIFFFGWGDVVLEFIKNCPTDIDKPHSELKKYIDENFKYGYTGTNQQSGKSVEGMHYRLIRSNMVTPFNYYQCEESQSELLTDNPNVIQRDFQETLRELEMMYLPGVSSVLLIGESCSDEFIYGDVTKFAPEAPIPVFKPKKTIVNSGMAGNVKNQLREFNVEVGKFITNTNKIVKRRFVDETSNYILMRCDEGDDEVDKFNIENLPDIDVHYIVFSDYDKGFINENDIESTVKFYRNKIKELNEEGYNQKLVVFMDTKKKLGDWVRDIDYIKLNYKEYLHKKEYFDNNDEWLKEKLIITRGEYGCLYNGENFETNKVNVKDVSGAGDVFLASLVIKYMYSREIKKSIDFANLVSELVVQKKGVSNISIREIEKHKQNTNNL